MIQIIKGVVEIMELEETGMFLWKAKMDRKKEMKKKKKKIIRTRKKVTIKILIIL